MLLIGLIVVTSVFGLLIPSAEAIPGADKATQCDSATCKLPNCLCMSTTAPLGLKAEEIPQLVFLTFDDAIFDSTQPIYQKILENRYNPNGCPIAMTFYVTHSTTNYQLTNSLYNQGNEMASHTVTHNSDLNYWANGTVDSWMKEIDQLRDMLYLYANVPKNQVQGFRAPYLQTGGDTTFEALQSLGMTYDSSLSFYHNPPIWPFTADYGETQNCTIDPCPTGHFPGLWEIPIMVIEDSAGNYCAQPDFGCDKPNDTASALEFFKSMYKPHELNRTPFGVYQHPYWLQDYPHILDGFNLFLDYLSTIDNVYIVSVSKGIEWLRNPLTLEQLKENDIFGCAISSIDPAPCEQPLTCSYGQTVLKTCNSPCPPDYPWLQ